MLPYVIFHFKARNSISPNLQGTIITADSEKRGNQLPLGREMKQNWSRKVLDAHEKVAVIIMAGDGVVERFRSLLLPYL